MDRLLLTLLVVAFFALAVYGMWRGWRRQARTQSVRIPPFPELPENLGEPTLTADGLYVATTNAGHWQERVVTRGVGMRGPAVLRLYEQGVHVDRAGAVGIWIPRSSIVDVKPGKGMAGKVMGTESLLVFTWSVGDVELDTGFRGDDHGDYPQWINEVKGGAQV
ncbi:PH-like domain-containing protein [Prauserella cavernicola]|uniref:Transporter n=1 Tax=Prauserella cavernicola TaxID=2800127 RepID=A0A934QXH5_9PSEU|nr:transporter [Prauserella cavernicola]MBK1788150.1 transporter [Prauserella cavernicola]